jgi:transposase
LPLPVEDIFHVLSTLQQEVSSLKASVSSQGIEISGLYRRLDRKDKEILALKGDNNALRDRLSKYEKPPKGSHNSSIPPSKENINTQHLRRTQSLRVKSDRKTGGQPGHEGSTLDQILVPDKIISHVPQFCQGCGCSLGSISSQARGVRQVIDLPEIQPIVSEHRVYGKQCTCGCFNQESFPREARSKVCYGFNIRAMVCYLSTIQCVPYERLCEVLRECFHVELSQGTVNNMLESMKKTSSQVYEQIRSQVSQSQVVGADETGSYVDGKLQWIWAFQTNKLTYLYQDASRGKQAIDKHFPDGLPGATLVTDRFAPYFNCLVKDHQICLAHLLRELTYLCELDKNQDWSSRLMQLLREAIHKRKIMKWETIPRTELFNRLDELLNHAIDKLHDDFQRLQRSLLKHRDNIFRFLSNPKIPYDNNASERAIRLVKVKQKVSGCFRSDQGADIFTQLLSVADTARKNGMSRYKAISLIAQC